MCKHLKQDIIQSVLDIICNFPICYFFYLRIVKFLLIKINCLPCFPVVNIVLFKPAYPAIRNPGIVIITLIDVRTYPVECCLYSQPFSPREQIVIYSWITKNKSHVFKFAPNDCQASESPIRLQNATISCPAASFFLNGLFAAKHYFRKNNR